MDFQIMIADRIIEIHSLCSLVHSISKDYLVSSKNNIPPSLTINTSDNDILKELNILRNINIRNDLPLPIIGEAYCESLSVLRKIADDMPLFDTFLLHGAVVSKDHQAYIFTADSGVGKTTRARLWLEVYPDSIIVNGDKPLIKVTKSNALACGTPWCGKEGWNTNINVPIKAIFLLNRAEDGNNIIEEVDLEYALPTLLRQIHRPDCTVNILKTMQLIKSLEGKVKFYDFHSAPTREAIRLAYETVNNG